MPNDNPCGGAEASVGAVASIGDFSTAIVQATQALATATHLLDGLAGRQGGGVIGQDGAQPMSGSPLDMVSGFLSQLFSDISTIVMTEGPSLFSNALALSAGGRDDTEGDATALGGELGGLGADVETGDETTDPVAKAKEESEEIIAVKEEQAKKSMGLEAMLSDFGTKMKDDLVNNTQASLKSLGLSEKESAIGSIIVKTATGVMQAMSSAPFPVNLANAALVSAKGAASLATVKGAFHDGISNVPSTGTYLLERGERVVDSRLNADLKRYLGNAQLGGSQSTFSPQITINGSADTGLIDQLEERLRDIHAEHLSTGFV